MKQKLIDLQIELDKSIYIVRDFNTPLSIIDRIYRQKINKDIEHLDSKYQSTRPNWHS